MRGNLMLPESPESKKQAVLIRHSLEQHLVPVNNHLIELRQKAVASPCKISEAEGMLMLDNLLCWTTSTVNFPRHF